MYDHSGSVRFRAKRASVDAGELAEDDGSHDEQHCNDDDCENGSGNGVGLSASFRVLHYFFHLRPGCASGRHFEKCFFFIVEVFLAVLKLSLTASISSADARHHAVDD